MAKTRVMIVDDSRIARELFTMYVNGSENYEVVSVRESTSFPLRILAQEEIELVIMDVLIDNGDNGLIAAEQIKQKYPKIKIVAVTSMVDGSWMKRARKIGIDSFWFKEVSEENIMDIMDRTMAGECVYPDSVSTHGKLINDVSCDEFTEAELRVLRLMTAGMSNSRIAEELNIAESTVKNHIHSMLEKTGCENRTILAIEARISGVAVNLD